MGKTATSQIPPKPQPPRADLANAGANSRCSASAGSATFEQYKRSSDDAVCKFTAHECDSLDYFMKNGLLMHRRDGETFITDQSGNENHLKQNAED